MADSIITSLGLCAGTGMLDYGLHVGLEYIGLRTRILGYVERDAFAASILLARMADKTLEPAPVWAGNLEDVRFQQWHGCLDFIVAGFPCQPWSAAGNKAGTNDDRWIWPDIALGIREAEPRFCWLENVRGLVSGGGLEFVLSDLASLGLHAEWGVVAASDVGASHERERIFILAYREGERLSGGAYQNQVGGGTQPTLVGAAQLWPTPASRDHKGENSADHLEAGTGRLHLDQLPNFVKFRFSHPDQTTVDGEKSSTDSRISRQRLNPAFAAWLMNWPWWWTNPSQINSAASAMASYRCSLLSHLSRLLGEQGLSEVAA